MIISRTPLRVSFCGGGTDLEAYYKQAFGAVVSTAIDKYMYITVNTRFDDSIRLAYTKMEIVEKLGEMEHELVRETLKLLSFSGGMEITTMADVPGRGTGLGSSSSLVVGLLNALYAFKGEHKSAESLAREACKIEIELLKEPIGKQDQYIAAYGGFNFIRFNPDGTVFVDPIIMRLERKKELENSLLMFYTGVTRRANTILSEQREKTENNLEVLDRMRDLAIEAKNCLTNNNELIEHFGELLHENWELKKKLAGNISNPIIDKYYERARQAGAIGGKILGAGGGGFMLFFCPPEKQDALRQALGLREKTFKFEPQGSKIIYVCD